MDTQYYSAPPAYGAQSAQNIRNISQLDAKQIKFDEITRDLGLEMNIKAEVRCILCGTKKVIIIDNSQSMNASVNSSKTHLDSHNFGGVVRRYDELKELLKKMLPIMAIDSCDGVDVYWLNNPFPNSNSCGTYRRLGIHSYDEIIYEMNQKPIGDTPLLKVLRTVFDNYTKIGQEIYMHATVFLDGEPNGGYHGKMECRHIIRERPNPDKNIINFIVCTDNDNEIRWLNKMDRLPGIDVIDDYNTERREVLRAKRVTKFDYNDYVLKACIGAASEVIDKLDEPSILRRLVLALTCK